MAEDENSLGYTPTWVVAGVCFVIVLLSLLGERGLHRLGKLLKHKKQDALFEALQKLKEELMLLGFISLLLTVSQSAISHICIPHKLSVEMLPCKRETGSTETHHNKSFPGQATTHWRHLLSTETNAEYCKKGEVPLLSLEALHQLHIFIFVLAVVHVIFCATTMVLGGARISQWKHWEDSLFPETEESKAPVEKIQAHHHEILIFKHRGEGYWRKAAVISWMMSFFRQFYHSVKKSDYLALRRGFIKTHCPSNRKFNFHKYMMRTLEIDFKKIVGISWFLWLFVVVFLLLNVAGWHSYFWLAFLPLILLLLVGAKLEHIITRLAQETVKNQNEVELKPSDEHFWFHRPEIVLRLIHFILFQNSFEIAFFFWIWSTYGFHSCIMERLGYIITRLIIGVVVQVLCSYSTLPLYALVTQMGSKFKRGMFEEHVQSTLDLWVGSSTNRNMIQEPSQISHSAEQEMVVTTEISSSLP